MPNTSSGTCLTHSPSCSNIQSLAPLGILRPLTLSPFSSDCNSLPKPVINSIPIVTTMRPNIGEGSNPRPVRSHCSTCTCVKRDQAHALSLELADARIDALRSELQSLIVYRNSIAPIHQLPSELLLRIFQHAAHRTDFWASTFEDSYDIFILQLIASVCSRWRTLTLDNPHLWTFHLNPRGGFLEEALRRSANSPLIIAYDENEYNMEVPDREEVVEDEDDDESEDNVPVPLRARALEMVALNFERVRTLSFHVAGHYVDRVLEALPSNPFSPRLEILRVLVTAESAVLTQLTLDAPRLHTLVLSSLEPHRRDFLFQNLADMSNFVAQFPLLQHLEICHTVNDTSKMDDLSPICHPELKSLIITDRMEKIGSLISCFKITKTTKLTISLSKYSQYTREDSAAALCDALRVQLLDIISAHALRRLCLLRDGSRYLLKLQHPSSKNSTNDTVVFEMLMERYYDSRFDDFVSFKCMKELFHDLDPRSHINFG